MNLQCAFVRWCQFERFYRYWWENKRYRARVKASTSAWAIVVAVISFAPQPQLPRDPRSESLFDHISCSSKGICAVVFSLWFCQCRMATTILRICFKQLSLSIFFFLETMSRSHRLTLGLTLCSSFTDSVLLFNNIMRTFARRWNEPEQVEFSHLVYAISAFSFLVGFALLHSYTFGWITGFVFVVFHFSIYSFRRLFVLSFFFSSL